MFVRFVIREKDPICGVREGVFGTAYELQKSCETPDWQAQELKRLLIWFGANLEAPDRFNKTKFKGHYRRNGIAISWFKPGATEHISKIHEMIVILEELGYAVEMIKTSNPGYIVYEDDHQVTAVPFSSTRTG